MRRFDLCALFIVFIINVLPVHSQTPPLRFEELSWDFGEIAEAGGKVTHRFVFSNSGGHPVVVSDAVATCGCTVAAFSKRPVSAGERSEIVVTFDPTNRPGAFDKSVSVFTSEGGAPIRLRITGRVVSRERSVEELYPCELGGGLWAAATSYDFGTVPHGTTRRSAVGIVNRSSRPIAVRLRCGRSSGRLDAGVPMRLAAGERASLDFGYGLPVGCGVYGTLTDEIGFAVDGRSVAGRIVVSGIAVDSPLVYSDNSAPKAEISENIVKFGPIKRSSGPAVRRIVLRNGGERPLTVRAVECGAFGCSLQPGERIAAGGRTTCEIRLTPAGCDYGVVVERIRIVTDDPGHPVLTVRATAVIVE